MTSQSGQMHYPPARRSEHVDIYKSLAKGEVEVHDPYNWLEKSSPETDQWINEQVSVSRAYLDSDPNRTELEKQFMQNMDYIKVCPFRLYNRSIIGLTRPSSAHPNAKVMVVGIGTTIQDYSRSRCFTVLLITFSPIFPTPRIFEGKYFSM
jgi:hypothetical protein